MIAIICGKSASGKDTLFRELAKDGFNTIISQTSRPMREGEQEGREYYFHSKEEFEQMIKEDKLIEYRAYNTLVGGVPDVWYYGTAKDNLDMSKDYIDILDLKGAENFVKCLGRENCFVCYIDVDDAVRQKRAEGRGSFDKTEWNRRALTDAKDFSAERVEEVCDCVLHNDSTIEELKGKFTEAFEQAKEENEKLGQMELFDHLYALAKDGEHNFLEDLNDSELKTMIEHLSEKYGRLWKKDPQKYYLETILADGHYAYTSARDMEMGFYTRPVGSDMGLGMYGEPLPALETEDREDL